MDSIDEARKREARNHLLMLPVVALLLVFILGIYIVIFSKEFEFFGTIFYGFAKAIWFLNLVFMGGSALISLPYLFCTCVFVFYFCSLGNYEKQ